MAKAKKTDAPSPSDSVTTALPSGTEMRIPLSKIVANKDFNARKFLPESAIKEMATSLKREDQLAPVRVAPRADGKYDLIYGFRRFAAACLLHEKGEKGPKGPDGKMKTWDYILATVDQSGNIDQQARMIQNLVENEARQDLTTYERALRYKEMIELKPSGKEKPITQGQLAAMTHKSQGYVSRLISGATELDPKLLQRWKKDCEAEIESDDVHSSLITMTSLKILLKLDKEAQLKWLDEQENGKAEDDGDGEEGDGEGDGKGPAVDQRTSTRNIRAALIAAEESKKNVKSTGDVAFVEGVLAGLKYALKIRKIDHVLTVKDGKPHFVGGESDGKMVPVPRK